jgi:hypothetical protein
MDHAGTESSGTSSPATERSFLSPLSNARYRARRCSIQAWIAEARKRD